MAAAAEQVAAQLRARCAAAEARSAAMERLFATMTGMEVTGVENTAEGAAQFALSLGNGAQGAFRITLAAGEGPVAYEPVDTAWVCADESQGAWPEAFADGEIEVAASQAPVLLTQLVTGQRGCVRRRLEAAE